MSDVAQIIDLNAFKRRQNGEEIEISTVEDACAFVSHEIFVSKVRMKVLAKRAGVSPATVSNIAYRITRSPHISTVIALLRALGFQLLARRL